MESCYRLLYIFDQIKQISLKQNIGRRSQQPAKAWKSQLLEKAYFYSESWQHHGLTHTNLSMLDLIWVSMIPGRNELRITRSEDRILNVTMGSRDTISMIVYFWLKSKNKDLNICDGQALVYPFTWQINWILGDNPFCSFTPLNCDLTIREK